jgi:hypothetical protein
VIASWRRRRGALPVEFAASDTATAAASCLPSCLPAGHQRPPLVRPPALGRRLPLPRECAASIPAQQVSQTRGLPPFSFPSPTLQLPAPFVPRVKSDQVSFQEFGSLRKSSAVAAATAAAAPTVVPVFELSRSGDATLGPVPGFCDPAASARRSSTLLVARLTADPLSSRVHAGHVQL